jgi:ABC-type lipoprotein export system ATPase subunit
MAEFRALNRDARMTFVMVTHNLRLAGEADRIFHIADGALVS